MSLRKKRIFSILLLAVVLLAAFFRFWHLDSMPPGLYHDEAYNGLDALSLNQGKTFPRFYEGWELYAVDAHAGKRVEETRFPVFFEGNYGREPLHVYLMALSVFFFGATPFAIRAVPAAAGVLAVITTFLAAQALVNNLKESNRSYLTPLIAAATMAVLYPAVHFSRFGIRAMVFVPLETLAVAFFWWGINRAKHKPKDSNKLGTWLYFLFSGFLLGLAIYTFAASRLLPFVWIIFVPLWFWRDRQALTRHWLHIMGMTGSALLTALPLLHFFWRYPYYFIFRIAYVANKGQGAIEGRPWMTWLLNVGRVVRGFLWYGETHLRHNLPGRPYLDLVQVTLFLLGIMRALRGIIQPQMQFLLIWFSVMLLPSILSGDAPHFGRLAGAAAPAAILIGLGGTWVYVWLSKAIHRRMGSDWGKALGAIALLLLFLTSAVWTARDYFIRYAQHPDLDRDFYLADWQLGQYARSKMDEGRIYLSPTQEELATILFALEDTEQLRNYNGDQGLIPAGIPDVSSLYLLRPDEHRSLDALQLYFPEGTQLVTSEKIIPFRVKAEIPRNRLEMTTDIAFDEKIKLVGWQTDWEEAQLRVTLAWQAQTPMDKEYTAYVHLTDSDGKLLAQLDRPPAGYPTSDWQPHEIIVDSYVIPMTEEWTGQDSVGLSTGFYYLPTLESLGDTAVLDEFPDQEWN
jgi:4-amino-4-deoxy-L-arabinose transferase-like glycosyltransferase